METFVVKREQDWESKIPHLIFDHQLWVVSKTKMSKEDFCLLLLLIGG